MQGPLKTLSAALLGASVWASAADSVSVSDGAAIEGQVIRDEPLDPLLVVNTGGKLLCLNRADVVVVKLDEDGRAEYKRRLAALNDKNAPAHFELYKWAKSRRLYDYADQELSATLTADAMHAEARKIVADLNAAYRAAEAKQKIEAASFTTTTAAAGPDEPVIGLRAPARMKAEEDEKILAYCKQLLPGTTADDQARKSALAALNADKSKSTTALANCLDPLRLSDAADRMTVLGGIEAAQPVSPELSKRLALASMGDPSDAVRKKSVALIKSRNDEWAMLSLVQSYIGSFEEGGRVRDSAVKAAAGEALEGLNDKRVTRAMLYYATLEVRATVSELNNFVTRQIDSYTVNSGAQFTVLVPLSFPIQFPELKLTKVRTTVVAPCAALESFTGKTFGNDLEAWAEWIRKQK